MRLITGTGVVWVLAFTGGVITGTAWLMIAPIVAILAWSIIADRTTRWSSPKRWDRS